MNKSIKSLFEKYSQGVIHIGTIGSVMVASLVVDQEKKCTITTDRCFEYLFVYLYAQVVGDQRLKQESEKRYPYSLSLAQKQNRERLFYGAYATISYDGKQYWITLIKTFAPFGKIPGIYSATVRAESPKAAFARLSHAEWLRLKIPQTY